MNGYVMEADAAPRKMMKARSKNGPKGDVVLVEADGEFRYAVKSFDETAIRMPHCRSLAPTS